MLLREFLSPNNSQLRRGLDQNPAGAEIFRAAGWGIVAAGAFVLLLIWSRISPWIPAVTLLLAGALLLLRASSFWPTAKLPAPEAAFQVMPAHLAALDKKGNVILVNDAWRQFAIHNGFRGEGYGEAVNYIELCESATGECAEEAREVAAGIRDVLNGKRESFSIEYPCHSPTEQRWFRCLVSRFPGEEQGALVTHIDITEQVRMRAQVDELKIKQAGTLVQKEAADRRQSVSQQEIADLKAALDEHAIVAICDREGRVLSVNDHYCEISKFSRWELIGGNANFDDIPQRAAAIRQGEKWQGEVRRRTRTGESYWVAETVVPFHDEEGGTSQFVVIGTDITGRKQAEASLFERGEELARSNAALAEFAYLASHDLQEPLRGVNGCVQLLAKRYGDQLDPEGRDWIRHAVLNTERMQSLITGLLDLSRIERHPAIRATALDAHAVLAAAIGALTHVIKESGAVVSVVGHLPLLQGDPRQIGQIFQNLIANSLKFRGSEAPRIEVRSQPTGGAFEEFIVRDNGIGIDPRHADRIFGVFQRLHAQGKFPGAGIGLSIAKRIVERHGGQIWVEEVPPGEVGAEFRFTLPLYVKADQTAAPQQRPKYEKSKGATVST